MDRPSASVLRLVALGQASWLGKDRSVIGTMYVNLVYTTFLARIYLREAQKSLR
jgi:hypothetical protein